MKIHNLPQKIDLTPTILWQYAKAERLISLIKMFEQGSVASSVALYRLASTIFDIQRPIKESDDDFRQRSIGLTILSQLMGIERPYWYKKVEDETVKTIASYEVWRRYIQGMIYLMDSDCSVTDINEWLQIVFPEIASSIYVIDNYDMTIEYVFPGGITDETIIALRNIPNFLPSPAGVRVIGVRDMEDRTLGFDVNYEGSDHDAAEDDKAKRGNFNNATFKNTTMEIIR